VAPVALSPLFVTLSMALRGFQGLDYLEKNALCLPIVHVHKRLLQKEREWRIEQVPTTGVDDSLKTSSNVKQQLIWEAFLLHPVTTNEKLVFVATRIETPQSKGCVSK
jgi:hypothetical protein